MSRQLLLAAPSSTSRSERVEVKSSARVAVSELDSLVLTFRIRQRSIRGRLDRGGNLESRVHECKEDRFWVVKTGILYNMCTRPLANQASFRLNIRVVAPTMCGTCIQHTPSSLATSRGMKTRKKGKKQDGKVIAFLQKWEKAQNVQGGKNPKIKFT